jgi:hypothetical protein
MADLYISAETNEFILYQISSADSGCTSTASIIEVLISSYTLDFKRLIRKFFNSSELFALTYTKERGTYHRDGIKQRSFF